MTGKTVLITGATDGIGKQTALELIRLGATVIVHGRNPDRVRETLNELRTARLVSLASLSRERGGDESERAVHGAMLYPVVADFSSLQEVRQLAKDVQGFCNRLDVLINNAGTYARDRVLTKDGYEMTFAVNHLAHFLLTRELLELVKRSSPARIITVSSVAHTRGKLEFDNLQSEKRFDPYGSYAQSKLANVLFSNELAKRLEGTGVTSNSLHPGVIATKLLRVGFNIQGASVQSGAATSVHLASSSAVEGVTGKYFANLKQVEPLPIVYDAVPRRKLWEISERLVDAAM